jgi:hypothetical protein
VWWCVSGECVVLVNEYNYIFGNSVVNIKKGVCVCVTHGETDDKPVILNHLHFDCKC